MIFLMKEKPGRRCKLIRAYKGLSAEFVALRVGFSKTTLSRFENGWEGRLPDKLQSEIAQVLEVPIEDLFGPVEKG